MLDAQVETSWYARLVPLHVFAADHTRYTTVWVQWNVWLDIRGRRELLVVVADFAVTDPHQWLGVVKGLISAVSRIGTMLKTV